MIEDKETIDFLQRKGAMEILVEMEYEPQRHTDLREKLLLSSSTVHDRLKVDVQQGLWEQTLQQRPDGVSEKVYVLTDNGQEVWEAAQEEQLRQFHMARRDTVQRVRNAENAVLREVSPDDAEWRDDIDSRIEIDRFEMQQRLDNYTTDT